MSLFSLSSLHLNMKWIGFSGIFMTFASLTTAYSLSEEVSLSQTHQHERYSAYEVKALWETALDEWGHNEELKQWINTLIDLCEPSSVYLVDGSEKCTNLLKDTLVANKTITPLRQDLWPDCYVARSHPDDVARVEEKTFIASQDQEDAGPTNNWMDPSIAKRKLQDLFQGAMHGRTMYVIPFAMGPIQSPYSRVAIEVTDSPYVALSLTVMTRTGKNIFNKIPQTGFVKCIHSVGKSEKHDDSISSTWPCDPDRVQIIHFPEELSVWSYGSGYGGNALLNKKCFALRLASVMGKNEGWLAEHMLAMKITNPEGKSKFFLAAFPSACGKTNLAMLQASKPGWKVECIGDDIVWLHWAQDGTLRAINPEFGFFGVAPGTSPQTNPVAMEMIKKSTIFTNIAVTEDMQPWWEGFSQQVPKALNSWKGLPWTQSDHEKAAHPNARFTTPLTNCSALATEWNDPEGIPVSAIIFGGRRSSTIPLVREAFSWQHGVFMGASISSETTSAAKGKVGVLRHDPFAMLPFCGYNMGDYFQHWINMGNKASSDLHPRFYTVNWFLKESGSEDQYAWPGFGENIRALEWIFDRIDGNQEGIATPIGIIPKIDSFAFPSGISESTQHRLIDCDHEEWKLETKRLFDYFQKFQDRFPEELRDELFLLESALHEKNSEKEKNTK